jgi:hypothetical protein
VDIPERLTLHTCSIRLDGGTTTLTATDEQDVVRKIRLVQSAFAAGSTFLTPGRLYFDDEQVAVRSEDESLLVALLRNALILNETVTRMRDMIVKRVESPHYVAFAVEVDQVRRTDETAG